MFNAYTDRLFVKSNLVWVTNTEIAKTVGSTR